MQRGIFIAYLLPFVGLFLLLLGEVFGSSFLIFILVLQLLWAPVAIIHCIIQFFVKKKFPDPVPKHLSRIIKVFVLYIVILILGSEAFSDSFDDMGMLFIIYFGLIPWGMLSYFTYVQYLIWKTAKIEEMRTDILDIDLE